jgi:hypothetical protein
MSSVRGKLRNGKVEFDNPLPADWSEGAEVETRLTGDDRVASNDVLDTDEKWAEFFESIKEYQMNDEEYAEFQRILEERKQWQLANWEKYQQKIRGLFP